MSKTPSYWKKPKNYLSKKDKNISYFIKHFNKHMIVRDKYWKKYTFGIKSKF